MKDRLRPVMVSVFGGACFLFLMALSWLVGGDRGPAAGPLQSPSRIVSLAPSVTETLFALGLAREVVGVTDYCDFPAAARKLPRVGGFKGKSLETIVSLSPDLVVGTRDGNEPGLLRALTRLKVRVLTVQPSTLEGVIESVRTIGAATGREAEAEALAARLQSRLDAVHARVRNARPVPVLFVYGRDPLVLAGPGTFADDMVRWAGGENVAGDAAVPYPRFSMETVLARSPEVIIEGAMGSEGAKAAAARVFWSRWESLPAVRDGRIEIINESLIARPGPRIFDGLELLALALHPELFAGAGGGG
jgi:iron complex transport system substrate-binding protein